MKKMTKRLACLMLALVLACCALPGVTYGATTSVDLNQNYLFRARTNAFSFGTGETANLTFTPQYTAKYTLKLYGHVTGGRNIRASLTNPDGTVTDFEYPNRTGSTVKDYSRPYLTATLEQGKTYTYSVRGWTATSTGATVDVDFTSGESGTLSQEVGLRLYLDQTEFTAYSQQAVLNAMKLLIVDRTGAHLEWKYKDAMGSLLVGGADVIADGSSFKVTLNNGKEYTATMVGADSQTDIGVLSIEATGLQAATFADSKSLTVGEQVVAIGCPGGLEFKNSVTSGYISALDRPVESSIGYDNECIQTDAAINPGNSGGALFNMQGQVIGINSSKIASTEYEGMGFAVPSSTAVDTANSLIKNGYVAGRAKIGVTYNTITSYNNADAILSALTEKGFKNAKGTMVINQVSSDSDLAGKQVKQYDMIVAVNGKTMTSTDVMTQVLSDSKPGDTIKLTIARIEGNQIKTFKVDCKLIESKGN